LADDLKPYRCSEAHRFGQSGVGITPTRRTARLGLDMNDERGTLYVGAYACSG
jgi:hypothetical protein